ncbi:histidine phosphatase family protein [Clostridium sp. UBA6640]|uniref:histidine phosphatase family protein n=1 Tax=Clostridium sp. UBA6640 TaxID=1946370 RepID=UPI0025BEC443|nr:histidine phosphatase family protein [Clostridium sp. UBA6640]
MKTNIYLVRHAHSNYSGDELNRPLSHKGVIDRNKITEILVKENIDLVISSPYKRAIETVEVVANLINKSIIIEEGFKERKLCEYPVDNFEEAIVKLWTNPSFSFEGGESNIEAQARGVNSLNNILDNYSGKNIAIGTHGNIMVLIMNYYCKNYDFDFWKELKMPDAYKLIFEDKKLLAIEVICK